MIRHLRFSWRDFGNKRVLNFKGGSRLRDNNGFKIARGLALENLSDWHIWVLMSAPFGPKLVLPREVSLVLDHWGIL